MASIDILYINLDRATERREALEKNFQAANFSPAWRLHRFPAINATTELVQSTPGPALPALKANWLSHLTCMKLALAQNWDSHVLIAEDDAEFSPLAEHMVNQALNSLESVEWDVVFLDILIPRAFDMPFLFSLRQKCAKDNSAVLLNLGTSRERFIFAGAGAYIINKASLPKMISLFTVDQIPGAFDMILRNRIYSGQINAHVIFPFPATVSAHADDPQVGHPDNWVYDCSLMHEFRRLIWAGTELNMGAPTVAPGGTTPEIDRFTSVLGRLMARQHGLS